MFHHRFLRMAFCICLGVLMGAYLAKGFSQQDLQFAKSGLNPVVNPIVETTQTIERNFFDTSFHLLRLKYNEAYRNSYTFTEDSNIVAYIGNSNLQKETILSNLTLSVSEQAINRFYGDSLSSAAKSDAVVAEGIQRFKNICYEKNGRLLESWDSSKSMNYLQGQWLFKPVFWHTGTGIGPNSGVVCLKSTSIF